MLALRAPPSLRAVSSALGSPRWATQRGAGKASREADAAVRAVKVPRSPTPGSRSSSRGWSRTLATAPQFTPGRRRRASPHGLYLLGSPACSRESPGPPQRSRRSRALDPGALALLPHGPRHHQAARPTRATQPGTALRAFRSRKPRPAAVSDRRATRPTEAERGGAGAGPRAHDQWQAAPG